MTLSPTRNYLNCTFPRLTLHACALTRTISLSYRGISLSFHLVTEVFQLVTRYFTFPVRFQLNSDFSHTFFNGKHTHRTIISCIPMLIKNYQYIKGKQQHNLTKVLGRWGEFISYSGWVFTVTLVITKNLTWRWHGR